MLLWENYSLENNYFKVFDFKILLSIYFETSYKNIYIPHIEKPKKGGYAVKPTIAKNKIQDNFKQLKSYYLDIISTF